MASVLKNVSVTEENADDVIKKTDIVIKQIQDILLRQTPARPLDVNVKDSLKDLVKDLGKVGNLLIEVVDETDSSRSKKVTRQVNLIQETCDYTTIAIKRKDNKRIVHDLEKETRETLKVLKVDANEEGKFTINISSPPMITTAPLIYNHWNTHSFNKINNSINTDV